MATSSNKGSGKVRRIEQFRIPVADPTDAIAQVAAAERRLGRSTTEAAWTAARSELEAAVAEAAACWSSLRFRALPPALHAVLFSELAEEEDSAGLHVGKTSPDVGWTADSAKVRFLAACDVDDEHDPAWWAEEFAGDEWSLHERSALLATAYRANAPLMAGVR